MKRILLLCLALGFVALPGKAEEVTGRVLGPGDEPVPTARAFYSAPDAWRGPWQEVGVGPDGVFRVEVDMEKNDVSGMRDSSYAGRIVVWSQAWGLIGSLLKSQAANDIRFGAPREISGIVRDTSGKPIADANVELDMFIPLRSAEDQNQAWLFFTLPPELTAKYSTRSNREGRWKFAGLPASASIIVGLDDPKYLPARAQVQREDSLSPAPTAIVLKTERAGAVSGRVVDEEGAPATNLTVSAIPQAGDEGRNRGGTAKTDEKGYFKITSLKPGTYNISLLPETLVSTVTSQDDPTRVAKAIEGVLVKGGATAAAGELVLTVPAWVKGRVFDRRVGGPLPRVMVAAYSAGTPRSGARRPLGMTDAEGRFEVALVPGPVALFSYQTSPGMPSLNEEKPVEVRLDLIAGTTKTQSLFLTPSLVPLVGEVTDENGDPVGDARLIAGLKLGSGYISETKADGSFRFERLAVGTLQLAVKGVRGAEYDLVSPTRVTLPQPKDKKLHVVVRRIPTAELAGRVVSPEGKPVAGAEVRYRVTITTHHGNGWQYLQATSNEDGRFSLGRIRLEQVATFQSVQKAGYKLQSGGEAHFEDGAFVINDVVLKPLTREISGVVKDQDGAPIVGARVRASGDDYFGEAITNKNGHFQLVNQGEGEIEVLAAKDSSAARVTNVPGDEINLTLPREPKEPVAATGRALDIFQEQLTVGFYPHSVEASARALAPYAPEEALALLLEAPTDEKGAARSADEAYLTVLRAMTNSPQAASKPHWQWAHGRLNDTQSELLWLEGATIIAGALREHDAEATAEIWRRAQEGLPKVSQANRIAATAYVAAVAARLNKPEAEMLFEKAMQSAQGKESELIGPFAYGSPTWVIAALNKLPKWPLMSESDKAVRIMAAWNPNGAREVLDNAAKVLAAMPEDTRKQWNATFAWSSKYVIRAVGPSDAQAAHAIARRVDDDWNRATALALAAEFGTPQERIALARESLEARGPMTMAGTAARLGALLNADSPNAELRAASDEIFEHALMQIEKERRRSGQPYGIGEYSFYEASRDPAQARLRLEAEWARVHAKMTAQNADLKRDIEVGIDSAWQGTSIAAAMAAIDVDRALEMARMLPEERKPNDYSVRAKAVSDIGRIVLTPPAQRWRFSWGDESGFDLR